MSVVFKVLLGHGLFMDDLTRKFHRLTHGKSFALDFQGVIALRTAV